MLDFSVGHFIPVSRLGMVPSCRTKTRIFFTKTEFVSSHAGFMIDVWIVSWMVVLLDGWIEGYGTVTLPPMRLSSIFGILPDANLSNHATVKIHLPVKNVMSLQTKPTYLSFKNKTYTGNA